MKIVKQVYKCCVELFELTQDSVKLDDLMDMIVLVDMFGRKRVVWFITFEWILRNNFTSEVTVMKSITGLQ